jgi:hypothetical protein
VEINTVQYSIRCFLNSAINLSTCTGTSQSNNPFINFNLSWAFATFSPIRYSLFRYFNTSFRYRYSATFPKIAIRYSLFAIATFVSSVLRTASILGLVTNALLRLTPSTYTETYIHTYKTFMTYVWRRHICEDGIYNNITGYIFGAHTKRLVPTFQLLL